ncbi:hypothetical protein [Nocardia sp. NPDC051981]|uniref:hypothetical protein n=1 Tax=Nocardia sp. NPDC051981 TaxID=3155417 RepID=UPI003423F82E
MSISLPSDPRDSTPHSDRARDVDAAATNTVHARGRHLAGTDFGRRSAVCRTGPAELDDLLDLPTAPALDGIG